MNNAEIGPPGIGKTHLAMALGVAAVEKGYSVSFERIANLIKLLKTAEIQRKSEYRIRKIMKSSLVVIDEIGYTPIEKREANLFFNLVSEMYEKLSIIITSNKSFEKLSDSPYRPNVIFRRNLRFTWNKSLTKSTASPP